MERGRQLLAERNYSRARVEFRNALQIDPKDATARALVGLSSERLGEYQDAVRSYRISIAVDESLVMPRARLARIMASAGIADDALELLKPGLERAPQSGDLLAARALATAQTDRAAARKDAEEAVRLEPRNADAIGVLTWMLWRDGEREEAITLLRSATAGNPGEIDLRILLAQLYLLQEKPADAEALLAEVVRLDPARIENFYRLSQAYLAQGMSDMAISTLRSAIEAHPENVDAKLAVSQLIVQHKAFDQGEKQLLDYLRSSEDDLDLGLGLGRFYEVNAKADRADAAYRKVVTKADGKPQGLTARNRLAALAIARNDLESASRYIAEVLATNPRDGEALGMRAELAMRRGDPAAAVIDLRTALGDQPDSVPLAVALAQAYLRSGDTALAEQTLRSVVQAGPRNHDARFALAQLLVQLGKGKQALPVLEQLVSEQPNNVRAIEALARLQIATGDASAAVQTAISLQSLQPRSTSGFLLAGIAHEVGKRPGDARKAYEQAADAVPASADPVVALARLDLTEGKSVQALKRIDRALANQPDSAPLHAIRGDVLAAQGQPLDAAKSYATAIMANPDWVQVYRSQALAYQAAKQPEKAIASLRAGVKATNGNSVLAADLGSLLEQAGKYDDAIKVYEEMLASNPKQDLAINNLAMLLANHRADAASLKRAGELVTVFRDTTNPAFLDTYGWVMYRLGRHDEAVAALTKAIDVVPNAPELRYHLGMAQWKAGDKIAARANLEAALQSKAGFQGHEEAELTLAALTE